MFPKINFSVKINDRDFFWDSLKYKISKNYKLYSPKIEKNQEKIFLKFISGSFSKICLEGIFIENNNKLYLHGELKIRLISKLIQIIGIGSIIVFNILSFLSIINIEDEFFVFLLIPIFLIVYSWNYYMDLKRMEDLYNDINKISDE